MEPVATAWAISEPDSPASRGSGLESLSPKRLTGDTSRLSINEITEDAEWAALASAREQMMR